MATSVEELIKSSMCFGVAYDPTVKECKICEVHMKCKAKCEGGAVELPKKPKPESELASKEEVTFSEEKQAEKPKKKPAKVEKPKKDEPEYEPDMPDFKAMDYDDLMSLAVERGIDMSEFSKYDNNTNIKRMRVTMALKKTYVVQK